MNKENDVEFEKFWYSLKRNILNLIDRDVVERVSNYLNDLKKEERYEKIQWEILFFLEAISRIVFRTNERLYNCYIFHSNIKRWIRLTKKINFIETPRELKDYNDSLKLLKHRFELYIKINEIAEEEYDEYNYRHFGKYYDERTDTFEVEKLIKLGLKHEKILYSLVEIYDFYRLFKLKDIDIDPNLRSRKLIKKIKEIYLTSSSSGGV